MNEYQKHQKPGTDEIKGIISAFTEVTTKKENANYLGNFKGLPEDDLLILYNPEEDFKNNLGEFIGKKTCRSDYSDAVENNQEMQEEQKFSLDEYKNTDEVNQNRKTIIDKSNSNSNDISFNFNFKNEKENKKEIKEGNINTKKLIKRIKSNNKINNENKNKKRDERNDNLRKETIKKPVNSVKDVIEKIGKIKIKINLDDVFGTNYIQNRAVLKLKIYEIFCINPSNKKILEEAKPDPENEIIFEYLLTRTYEFIYEKFINNIPIFKIGGKDIEIKELNTFDDIIKERRNILKKETIEIIEPGKRYLVEIKENKYNEKDINEFINTSTNYFK